MDVECSVAMTYTDFFEAKGASRDQLAKGLAKLYADMRSVDGGYTTFDIGEPTSTFGTGATRYVFVPYSSTVEAPGRGGVKLTAFFIGISKDTGATWRFLDGVRSTPKTITAIVPDYQGQPPMPPISGEALPATQ